MVMGSHPHIISDLSFQVHYLLHDVGLAYFSLYSHPTAFTLVTYSTNVQHLLGSINMK